MIGVSIGSMLGLALGLGMMATVQSAEDLQEEQLIEKVLAGDGNAFRGLVEAYQSRIYNIIYGMVHNRDDALELTQDSFIKAYRAINNFRGDSAFYTWLYRIGVNTAKNHLMSLGRRPKAMNEVEIEDIENFDEASDLRSYETPESSMMTKEIAQTVNETIEHLPEELRSAITLREMDGLSYEEIAEIMDCPIGTVRSRIFRARESIAEKLKPLIETSNKRW